MQISSVRIGLHSSAWGLDTCAFVNTVVDLESGGAVGWRHDPEPASRFSRGRDISRATATPSRSHFRWPMARPHPMAVWSTRSSYWSSSDYNHSRVRGLDDCARTGADREDERAAVGAL